jgi:hypothetical protein
MLSNSTRRSLVAAYLVSAFICVTATPASASVDRTLGTYPASRFDRGVNLSAGYGVAAWTYRATDDRLHLVIRDQHGRVRDRRIPPVLADTPAHRAEVRKVGVQNLILGGHAALRVVVDRCDSRITGLHCALSAYSTSGRTTDADAALAAIGGRYKSDLGWLPDGSAVEGAVRATVDGCEVTVHESGSADRTLPAISPCQQATLSLRGDKMIASVLVESDNHVNRAAEWIVSLSASSPTWQPLGEWSNIDGTSAAGLIDSVMLGDRVISLFATYDPVEPSEGPRQTRAAHLESRDTSLLAVGGTLGAPTTIVDGPRAVAYKSIASTGTEILAVKRVKLREHHRTVTKYRVVAVG